MEESVHFFSCFLVHAHPRRNSSNRTFDSSRDNAENLDSFRIVKDQYDEDSKKTLFEENLNEYGHFRQENEKFSSSKRKLFQ